MSVGVLDPLRLDEIEEVGAGDDVHGLAEHLKRRACHEVLNVQHSLAETPVQEFIALRRELAAILG